MKQNIRAPWDNTTITKDKITVNATTNQTKPKPQKQPLEHHMKAT